MKSVFPKVLEAEVKTTPFPHVIVDEVLDDYYIKKIKENWPDPSLFSPSDRQARIYTFSFPDKIYTLSKDKRYFWTTFLRDVYSQIICANLITFATMFAERYGKGLTHVLFGGLMLQEADHGYVGDDEALSVHTHHQHDPLWLFTTLIYIDGDDSCGTTLYGWENGEPPGGLDRMAYIAAQSRQWHNFPELVPLARVDCVPNRLFSFADSPVSFHGVEWNEQEKPSSAGRQRRVIRAHVGALPQHCERIYGVSLEKYRDLRREPTTRKDVLTWLRRDIEFIRRPRSYAVTPEALAYVSRIDFLDFPGLQLSVENTTGTGLSGRPLRRKAYSALALFARNIFARLKPLRFIGPLAILVEKVLRRVAQSLKK